ncbi:MAG: hypothetical protein KKG59_03240 [Nanoarchaeota archaeon]|nr:hypothetical protein [Nanoarchaeota archaeon]
MKWILLICCIVLISCSAPMEKEYDKSCETDADCRCTCGCGCINDQEECESKTKCFTGPPGAKCVRGQCVEDPQNLNRICNADFHCKCTCGCGCININEECEETELCDRGPPPAICHKNTCIEGEYDLPKGDSS